jgi:superfamily II DNA or RNA helicase
MPCGTGKGLLGFWIAEALKAKTVIVADPKQSTIDIVQASGRAMRTVPGKKLGYIVIPVIVPNNVQHDKAAKATAFAKIARILSALSTQDGRIIKEVKDGLIVNPGTVYRDQSWKGWGHFLGYINTGNGGVRWIERKARDKARERKKARIKARKRGLKKVQLARWKAHLAQYWSKRRS